MASETLLICVLMLSSVRVIKSAGPVFNVTCQPAVGVIGQITHISCSIESQTEPVVINTVALARFSETIKPCFTFQPYENRVTGDSRFKVESLPSLQLHNTAISDEGGYKYYIRTNQGNVNVQFTINVTANYSSPIITSELTASGRAVDLYCNTSGGYPAGTIQWFHQRNTNWTQNAKLQITQGHDGLFTLISKLSFRSIHATWGTFRCVVLNYRYEEEGESMSVSKIKDNTGDSGPIISTQVYIIIGSAGVFVFLVAVFPVVLLLIKRCLQPVNPVPYERAADAEETIAVTKNPVNPVNI